MELLPVAGASVLRCQPGRVFHMNAPGEITALAMTSCPLLGHTGGRLAGSSVCPHVDMPMCTHLLLVQLCSPPPHARPAAGSLRVTPQGARICSTDASGLWVCTAAPAVHGDLTVVHPGTGHSRSLCEKALVLLPFVLSVLILTACVPWLAPVCLSSGCPHRPSRSCLRCQLAPGWPVQDGQLGLCLVISANTWSVLLAWNRLTEVTVEDAAGGPGVQVCTWAGGSLGEACPGALACRICSANVSGHPGKL